MPRCGCDGRCNCIIKEGSNITISGQGTPEDPYIITGDRVYWRETFAFPRTPLLINAASSRIYNAEGRDLTLVSVHASVTTAPTGDAVIVDIRKNGVSIFNTNNRPKITVGQHVSLKLPNVKLFEEGKFLTCHVVAVDSGATAGHLVVQVRAK